MTIAINYQVKRQNSVQEDSTKKQDKVKKKRDTAGNFESKIRTVPLKAISWRVCAFHVKKKKRIQTPQINYISKSIHKTKLIPSTVSTSL